MPDQNIGFPTKGAVRQPAIDVDFTGHSASEPRLPGALHMAAIISFLGYNPVPEPNGEPEKLVWQRTSLGLSQEEAARQMGVDPGTLARWELGERTATLLD